MALQDILERKETLLKPNDMKNKEKAEEIAYENNIFGKFIMDRIEATCLEMARWQDEQLNSAIDKALERNGEFLKAGKITQYGYDIAFATIQNIREYLKL